MSVQKSDVVAGLELAPGASVAIFPCGPVDKEMLIIILDPAVTTTINHKVSSTYRQQIEQTN